MGVPADDLRLKHRGAGNPVDYQLVAYRASEGRPFPSDLDYGYESPPELSFGPDGQPNQMKVKLRMNVGDVPRFVQHFVGFGGAKGDGTLNRTLPFNDPDGYGMVGVGCGPIAYINESGYNPTTQQIDSHFMQITDRDQSALSGFAMRKYRYAVVTCTFAHLPYHLVPDAQIGSARGYGERARYMSTIQTASVEYVSLDRAIVFWNDANNPAYIAAGGPVQVATGGGLVRAVSEIITTWYRVPQDALPSLMRNWNTQLGCVNDADFLLPFYNVAMTYPAETCLFQPWRLRERMGPLGSPEYDVELRWLFRNNGGDGTDPTDPPKGWNHFLYPPDGNYYRVSWGTGAPLKKIYETVDMNFLFSTNR